MRRIAILLSAALAFCFIIGGVASATPAPARLTCTSQGGVSDGGNPGPPGQAWAFWTALPKPEPACQEQLRVEVYSQNGGGPYGSGWLKSTSANIGRHTTETNLDGGSLLRARMEVQYTDDASSRQCLTFYPVVGTWHSCTNIKRAVLASYVAPTRVTVTWYHICMALDHNLCAMANGAGPDLTVVTSGANKWQAIPDGGPIEWQNGSGNCMKATDTGNVTIVNGACNGGASKDFTVGGSGNLTFHSNYAGGYVGVDQALSGEHVHIGGGSGFDYGWVTEPA